MSGYIATTAEWAQTGKVSSKFLRSVYTTLIDRERARAEYRESSRDIAVPSRFHERESSKRKALKNLIKKAVPDTSREPSEAEVFYSVQHASTPITQNRNRYRDIEPYDRNRVVVGSLDGVEGRYLNASWVREVEGKAWWIAAQAPLFDTTHAFLSLFTSLQPEALRLKTIVQLTPMAENGIRKADQYIPFTTQSQSLLFYPEPECRELPPIEVTLKEEQDVPEAACQIRTVSLKLLPSPALPQGETFEITHIDYVGWPDHSVPTSPQEVVALVKTVSTVNAQASAPGPPLPILCHCSAGVGRTGTFIALSSLLRSHGILPRIDYPPSFPLNQLFPAPHKSALGPLPKPLADDPVAREVDGLREQRTTMVQRSEQLAMIYQVLVNTLTTQS